MSIYWAIYWFFAFTISIFWGLYAIWYEVNQYSESEIETVQENNNTTKTKKYWEIKKAQGLIVSCKKLGTIGSLGAFLSDFLLSLIGWGSLHMFINNYINKIQSNIDIFLALVAIICISGYGFKISDKISQFSK